MSSIFKKAVLSYITVLNEVFKMKALFLIAFYCLLTVSNTAFGEVHLTLEQLSSAIEQYNSNTDTQKIISLHTYRIFRHQIEGALSIEEYQAQYGITREDLAKKIFGNIRHLTPEQISNAIMEYNNNAKIKYREIFEEKGYNHQKLRIITSLESYRSLHSHIEGALAPETYQLLYGITEENFIKLVFGNMEHLTLEQVYEAFSKSYGSKEIRHMLQNSKSEKGFFDYYNTWRTRYNTSNDMLVFDFAIYHTLYGTTKRAFLKTLFGTEEYLSLDQLPKIIEEYNKRSKEKITSIKLYNESYRQISQNTDTITLPSKAYQVLYGITEEDFIKLVFGNMEHLTLEQLPTAVEQQNRNSFSTDKIASFNSYNKEHIHLYGALAFETYQALYGITEEDFIKLVFGNIEHLTPEQLPNAINQHNNSASTSDRINSFLNFTDNTDKNWQEFEEFSDWIILMSKLKNILYGALTFETYQVLYGIAEEDFIKLVFGNMEHIPLDELSGAIEKHNHERRDKKITSLQSYYRYHIQIKGTLDFETYQMLYGVTEEQFIKKAGFRKSTAKRKSPPITKRDKETKYLTLEELPKAIEEHNKKRNSFITSFERYQKHHHRIEGALSFEEYQASHEMTEEEFVRKVLGSMEHLTPNQLSTAIREHNNQRSTKITSFSVYQMHYTQIPGALPFETYKTLYGVTKEDFVKLIKNRCETEFTRI